MINDLPDDISNSDSVSRNHQRFLDGDKIKLARSPRKANKRTPFKVTRNVVSCVSCKIPFKITPPKVVWKDILECGNCGYIWVALDMNEALKYI